MYIAKGFIAGLNFLLPHYLLSKTVKKLDNQAASFPFGGICSNIYQYAQFVKILNFMISGYNLSYVLSELIVRLSLKNWHFVLLLPYM